ncbi:putative phage-associated protein [Actinokineospora baliensis]|uniref:type II toxin-antitoxin system antitoxin SocA domain-containing protein n=1 Tax=Actinokineospora baliensis TaxID=547056 RepID=UPI00195B8535|nr:type II toxin-antitoxin system antitoxin SocA domain-containing protein [Actinokineospora baliensis]MBM7770146.1 putative phage-associated protein [Actinokineospora baliensis]
MASVHDVVAAILDRTGPESPMKLQKLLYYTQGWHLGRTGEPLFPNRIEAWTAGPVVPEVYHRHEGTREVEGWPGGDGGRLSAADADLVATVVDRYGCFDRHQLSAMTHEEEPWRSARGDLPDSAPSSARVSEAVMARFFGRMITDPATAVAEAKASAHLEGLEVSDSAVAACAEVASGAITTDDAVQRRLRQLLKTA